MATVNDPAFIKRISDWAFADYVSIKSNATPARSLPIMREGVRSLEAFQPPKITHVAHVEEEVNARSDAHQDGESDDIDITLAANNQAMHFLPPTIQPVEDLWWAETCHRQAAFAAQGGILASEATVGDLDGMSMALGMDADVNWLELDADSATLMLGGSNNTRKSEVGKGSTESCSEGASGVPSSRREEHGGRMQSNGSTGEIPSEGSAVAKETRDGVVENDGQDNSERPAVDPALLAKQRKAQQRRERNRLCAQRSNMRAKAHRDTLKANLKSCNEQVEVLRAKELALRQENLKLRQALGQKS